jgi:adenine phosphoribosyltransferase
MDLKTILRTIPDFPKPGINFIDITPILKDSSAFKETVKRLAATANGRNITAIAAIESRGFIYGAAVAYELGVGFIPIRKPGKLPAKTISQKYDLEYGSDCIEMHDDCLNAHDRVLLVDDLLATGGTMQAAAKLVEQTGATVAGIAFVVELTFLHGREKLTGYDVTSLVTY